MSKMELEKKADDIMNYFNFEKVHNYMVETDWRWYQGEKMVVPSLEEIRAHSRSLLTQAIWHGDDVTLVGSGGFTAYKMPWGLELTFNLTKAYA